MSNTGHDVKMATVNGAAAHTTLRLPRSRAAPAIHTVKQTVQGIFEFEKLPPELQNKVYEFALITDSQTSVDITRRMTKGQRPRHRLTGTTLTMKGKSKRRLAFGKIAAAALLRVSKKMNDDAAPFLYANNSFAFDNFATFARFVWCIGHNVESLKKIDGATVGGKLEGSSVGGHWELISPLASTENNACVRFTLHSKSERGAAGELWSAIRSHVQQADAQTRKCFRCLHPGVCQSKEKQEARFDAIEHVVSGSYGGAACEGKSPEERGLVLKAEVRALWETQVEQDKVVVRNATDPKHWYLFRKNCAQREADDARW